MRVMKIMLTVLVAGGIGFAGAMFWAGHRPGNLPATESQPTIAQSDAVGDVATTPGTASRPSAGPAETAPAPGQRLPEDILNELAGIQVTPGPGQGRAQYRIMALLDQLAQCGQPALPAIRAFLASNRDVPYDLGPGNNRGNRNRNNANLLPPALRFGLFDVVREIGGAGAEQVLAEALDTTPRGA
jgi:hypothetical protein